VNEKNAIARNRSTAAETTLQAQITSFDGKCARVG
jgi:hypothetical protein